MQRVKAGERVEHGAVRIAGQIEALLRKVKAGPSLSEQEANAQHCGGCRQRAVFSQTSAADGPACPRQGEAAGAEDDRAPAQRRWDGDLLQSLPPLQNPPEGEDQSAEENREADEKHEHAELVAETALFCRLCGRVTEGNVADLVCHDAGHFAFVFGGFDHSAIDIHRPARQRKRIDVAGVDDFEVILKRRLLKFRRNIIDQSPTDAFQISG